MKTLFAATLGAAVAFSSPVYAQTAAQSSESVTVDSAAEDEGDKMVCKRKAVTGTRIKKRLCYTQAQWDRIERQSREMANEFKSLGGVDNVNRGG